MKPLDQVFWLRAVLGVAAGLLSGFLGFLGPGPNAYGGLLIVAALYALSFALAKYAIFTKAPPNPPHKLATAGLGTFIMIFLFTWILFNTVA